MDSNPIENAVAVGDHGNLIAKDGWVWRCNACGKRSRDMYGCQPIDRGFDESCAINCSLVKETP